MRQALLLFIILTLRTPLSIYCVRINALNVPRLVVNGSSRVLLDCDYSVAPSETGLVVRWFLNNNPTPVYQWIPSRMPQGLGALRGRIEPGAGAVSSPTAHRSLFIRTPTTELSGDWKCFVSTFNDEDFMTKSMIVFAPEKRFELKQTPVLPNGITNISCTATGVYPEPRLLLYGDRGSSSTRTPLTGVTVQTQARLADYDISAWALVQASSDPDEGLTTVSCVLRVPEANYSRFRSLVLVTGGASSTSTHCLTVTTMMAIYVLSRVVLSPEIAHPLRDAIRLVTEYPNWESAGRYSAVGEENNSSVQSVFNTGSGHWLLSAKADGYFRFVDEELKRFPPRRPPRQLSHSTPAPTPQPSTMTTTAEQTADC